MNLLDVFIALALGVNILRGKQIGLVRQLCSAAGFFTGLIGGVLLERVLVKHVGTPEAKALLSVAVVFGLAMACLSLGEWVGVMLKRRLILQHIKIVDTADSMLGAAVGVVTLLVGVWLGAAIFSKAPIDGLQRQIDRSFFVRSLDRSLPPAPDIISSLGSLIDPNGFPDVFVGLEPAPSTAKVNLPSLGDLQAAVDKDQASVVKIAGRGCGGVVDGSGFVADDGLVITNAHVVAGITKPYVLDANGQHQATTIFFDPDLDMAVLRVANLAGKPLPISTAVADTDTPVAVLGYPGGGDFTVSTGSVIDAFTAKGRNIYNQGTSSRQVYSVKTDVEPGNSGGPLVDRNGTVVGLVFAKSTTYDQVGYALTMAQVLNEFTANKTNTTAVATGSCAE